jgi:signal transduction histidine kinase
VNVKAGRFAESWRRLVPWSCHVLFYLVLVAVTAGALGQGTAPRAPLAVAALALGAWYGYWNLRAPGRLSRPAMLDGYLLVAGILWLALLGFDRGFALLGVVVFAQLFGRVDWRAALAVVLVVAGVGIVLGGFDGALGGARPLAWRGLAWGDAIGTAVLFGLVALCVYLDREVTNARVALAAAERRAGALIERGRLAADLHDTLAQDLASVVMLLQAAREAYRTGSTDTGKTLDRALATARDGLGEIRGLVWDLRPEALAHAGIDQAVAQLTERLAEQTGITAETVVTGEPRRLPTVTEAVLLRVAEEALTNVRRHAHANTVTVTLSYIDDVVVLDVVDDGVGFATDQVTPGRDGGLGLVGMRERVEGADGVLAIESAPGRGTSVAVQLPATRPARAQADA